MKKVAILAAPGFEEIELMAPLDILRRLNMDVVLAGVQSDKVVSTHEVTVSTDTMLDKLHADKLDALILPGGAGSWEFFDQVLDKANVATTPGAGFGPSGEGYIRLTAFGDARATKTAVERVANMFK